MNSVCSVFAFLFFLAVAAPPSFSADAVSAEPGNTLSKEERFRLGEQMYQKGILPSGKPMKAYVSDDVPVEGTAFTCTSCHLKSGMGSIEGEVVTPPTNGRILYQERKSFKEGAEFVPYIANYSKYLPVRPAYTDKTLTELLTGGADPTGRSVLRAMPRYELDDTELSIMLEYLKNLSDKTPPGVEKDSIRFATVIVEGSDPLAIESMLAPIQFSVDRKNSLAKAANVNFRVARMGYNMLGDLHGYTFTLSKWILKGSPDTWRGQLEEYYRKEPVFAFLGGISDRDWEPVHRFCEEKRIPNLFPVVDYPVISDSDWYTIYFSRGVRQEGEAAARYLGAMSTLFAGRPVIQIVRGTKRGEALAAGFRDTWKETGHGKPKELRLKEGEKLTAAMIAELFQSENPAALLLWDDEKLLEPLLEIIGKRDVTPGYIIASGTYIGKSLWKIPDSFRDRIHFTYPFRLPQDDFRYDQPLHKIVAGKKPLKHYDQAAIRQSYITGELLGKALMEMRGEYFRDYLLDTIGMMKDMYYPLYERVSFGPTQRYVSKGCYIVQLGKGENPQLVKKSEWVMP